MDEREKDGEERVEDLDVPESESEDVKGGNTWAGSQSVREAANNPLQKGDIAKKIRPGLGSFGDGSV